MNTDSLFIFIFISSPNLIYVFLICVLENTFILAFKRLFWTTFISLSPQYTTENSLKAGSCLSFLTLCSLCRAQYLTYTEGTHSNTCWIYPMGYEAKMLGQSDSFKGHGEIRKISHRDMWSKTHSIEEILCTWKITTGFRGTCLYFLIYFLSCHSATWITF